ncbi:hypothetical protein A5750_24980 [Mycobacterium sp. 852002-51613_SCH5001154]|uniref:hypothetical protein n=1 Tax=Mycobacterium sp. 852002-51613_SCH5001154 TaxID=1834104 RepID=UPI0007FD1EE1|nr:hypothetical protein [Mycobacterium sp. 852002-51613_SCH5001154]OBF70133.1 hypothetical protein A5750_24980 [Mycobacterium sp. 852002-51613_SCH5001154]
MKRDEPMSRVGLPAVVRSLVFVLAAVLFLFGLTGGMSVATGAAAPGPPQGCESQQGALDSVNAEIARHNAQPHDFVVPREQAAADAYDAEAAQLNARGSQAQANLNNCAAAIAKLADHGTLPRPSQDRIDKINAAKAGLPPGYAPPAPPPRNSLGGVAVAPPMQPVFKQLRQKGPWPDDLILQGQAKPGVGTPDPARNGAPIPGMASDPSRPAVVVDHIVPIAQLMYVPGFLNLPAEYMYVVANSPRNLQWLSAYANGMKNSDSIARIGDADPKWVQEQIQLENDTRATLQDLINQLLTTLPPSR